MTEVAPDKKASSGEEEVLDPVIVANLRSLLGPGDTKGGRALIEMFLQATPPSLAALRAAVVDGDAAAIAAVAHRLRGSSASFAARRMAPLCERIETLAASAETSVLQDLVAEVEKEFDRAQHCLREQFPE